MQVRGPADRQLMRKGTALAWTDSWTNKLLVAGVADSGQGTLQLALQNSGLHQLVLLSSAWGSLRPAELSLDLG